MNEGNLEQRGVSQAARGLETVENRLERDVTVLECQHASRARRKSSANVGFSARVTLTNSRFTKGPSIVSSSVLSRTPIGLPKTKSSWPVCQRSTVAQAAIIDMYTVAPCLRASEPIPAESS